MKAKPNTDLVVLQFSYWARFVAPADVAAQLMVLMSKLTNVEESDGMYLPSTPDWQASPLTRPFIADLPCMEGSDAERRAYLAYVKSKRELIGDGYVPESYGEYLNAKED